MYHTLTCARAHTCGLCKYSSGAMYPTPKASKLLYNYLSALALYPRPKISSWCCQTIEVWFQFFNPTLKGKSQNYWIKMPVTKFDKVNSVQEACAKCFAVHILKFEILQITRKKWNKEHQTLSVNVFCFVFSCGLQDFKF